MSLSSSRHVLLGACALLALGIALVCWWPREAPVVPSALRDRPTAAASRSGPSGLRADEEPQRAERQQTELAAGTEPAPGARTARLVIVDERQQPVEGAQVIAFEGLMQTAAIRSDQAGRVVIGTPQEVRAVQVLVSKSSFLDQYVTVEACPQASLQEQTVVLRRPPVATLRGVVIRQNDAPAAGVSVRASMLGLDRGREEMLRRALGTLETRTSEDGRFEISGVPAEVVLTVLAGTGGQIRTYVVPPLAAGTTGEMTLFISDVVGVEVAVVEEGTGAPIARANVQRSAGAGFASSWGTAASLDLGRPLNSGSNLFVQADASGVARLQVATGRAHPYQVPRRDSSCSGSSWTAARARSRSRCGACPS